MPGVQGVDTIQHHFAYVGADLQDLYGVNPASIRSVTALQDSYFLAGGTAAELMHTLQTKPDSTLVSSETVKDYQLHLGDLINLRLVDGRTATRSRPPSTTPASSPNFPTAHKDSFFVTNAAHRKDRQQRDRRVPHQHRWHQHFSRSGTRPAPGGW